MKLRVFYIMFSGSNHKMYQTTDRFWHFNIYKFKKNSPEHAVVYGY